jgi:HK97 family phage portal protein
MGLLGWLRGDVQPELEVRHTDTDPSAYPIEWQLDAVVWHQYHGQVSPERVPAVYAAIDLISASVAQLQTTETTPLSRQPDPFDTRYNFLFETVQSLCWHGDAFWLLTPTDRGIDSMQVLDPVDVDVEWDDQFRRRLRSYRWKTDEIPRSRIAHLRFHPRAGQLEGLSPIEAARMTWEGAAYSEEYGSSLFGASGVPSGVLRAPTPLSKEEAEELRSQWNTARSGGRNTAVLSGGMEYQPVELSPSDIGWLETRASNAQEVARIFHIPGDLLEIAIQGGASSVTYKNLAEVGADFVQYCLSPYLSIIEETWASLPGQPALTFDTSPLYRESLETRARTLGLLVAAGADPDSAADETGFPALPMTNPVQEVAGV